MASQKIAEFFAELGIKVSERSLRTLEKNLSKIVQKLEAVESRGRAMSGILKGTSKAADAENKSIQAGNKVLAERQKRWENVARAVRKVQKVNNATVAKQRQSRAESAFLSPAFKGYYDKHFLKVKAVGKNGGVWKKDFQRQLKALSSSGGGNLKARQAMYESLFGGPTGIATNGKAWQNKFQSSIAALTANSAGMKPGALRAQQNMYDNLFGAVDTRAQEKLRNEIEKAHAKALQMDKRRTAEAARRATIEQNNEKRLQALAAKTAAIKEAGAAKAAAIVKAAEIASQRVAGRSIGRPRSGFSGAAIGGSIGAAGSAVAGFLPGFGAAYALANANRISQEIQGQKMALTAVTGSEKAGAEAMGRLRSMGNEIGFDWRAVSGSFTKMLASGKGAGMAQGTTEQIFRSMAEYGRVMGLDPEAMKGSLRAVEQMMNKNQVMAEELKNQLGERFPAAVSLMAKAVSRKEGKEVSTADLLKMMEDGKVKSDVLVQFAEVISEEARVGGALEKAMRSTAAQQQRFNNSVSQMLEWMSEAGMDEGFGRVFGSMAKFIDTNEAGIKRIGVALNDLSKIFQAVVNGLNITLAGFSNFSNALGIADTTLAGLLVTGLAMLNPFTRIFTILSGVMAIIEDLYVYSQGGVSVFGEWMKGLDGESFNAIKEFENKLGTLSDTAQTLGKNLLDAFRNFSEYMDENGVGGKVLRGTVNVLGFMVDRLTELLGLMSKLAAGDFAGAMGQISSKVLDMGSAVGGLGIQAADSLLPGNPFGAIRDLGGSGINYLIEQGPENQRRLRMEEMIQRQRKWEESRSGKTGDVPSIDNSGAQINITIPGASDPSATAAAVRDELAVMFNLTTSAFPEEVA